MLLPTGHTVPWQFVLLNMWYSGYSFPIRQRCIWEIGDSATELIENAVILSIVRYSGNKYLLFSNNGVIVVFISNVGRSHYICNSKYFFFLWNPFSFIIKATTIYYFWPWLDQFSAEHVYILSPHLWIVSLAVAFIIVSPWRHTTNLLIAEEANVIDSKGSVHSFFC